MEFKSRMRKKKAGTNPAMPIRQSDAWVGGENASDIIIIVYTPQNL